MRVYSNGRVATAPQAYVALEPYAGSAGRWGKGDVVLVSADIAGWLLREARLARASVRPEPGSELPVRPTPVPVAAPEPARAEPALTPEPPAPGGDLEPHEVPVIEPEATPGRPEPRPGGGGKRRKGEDGEE